MKWKRQTRCQCCEMFLAGSLPGSWRTQTTVGCLLCPTAAHPTIPFVSLRSQMSPPQIAFSVFLFFLQVTLSTISMFLFLFLFFLWHWGIELRAPCLLGQSFHHLSHATSPFCFWLFLRKGLTLCPGWPGLQSFYKFFLCKWDDRYMLSYPDFYCSDGFCRPFA
jgi:hypothetical protein